jgi:hypothetical protein
MKRKAMNKHKLLSKLQELVTTPDKLDYQIYSDKGIASKKLACNQGSI